MNEQELNEKLTKWVWPKARIRRGEFGSEFIPSGKPFRTHFIDAEPVPSFTRSLDLCFRRLGPKLAEMGHCIEVGGIDNDCEYYGTVNLNMVGSRKNIKEIMMFNRDPALALCLACEKAIDSESERIKQARE